MAAPQETMTPVAATTTQQAPSNKSPVDQQDLNDWKHRFSQVVSRPGEVVNSRSPEGSQPWHAGFFDCFNPVDTCLMTYCLPCITFGRTHHRIRKDGTLKGYEPINTSCLLFCGAGCVGLHWIPLAMQRMDIREKYNLRGSCLEDLALSCCCHCCTMVQSDKEAGHREELLRSSGGGVQQQYRANTDEMRYPPPKAG